MHPWHDSYIDDAQIATAFPVVIEIPKGSTNKYELDKETGLLRLDRVLYSAVYYPADYGFIPRTYCDAEVQKLSPTSLRGDHDPLDICVLSERPITRNEILVRARVVGGFKMVDSGDADDKIIAVLDNDYIYGSARDIEDLPPVLVERLRHYFATYKLVPERHSPVTIERVYNRAHALKVVRAAMVDYDKAFGGRK